MKTTTFSFRTLTLLFVSVCMGALLIMSCSKDDDPAPVDNRPYSISGNASGAQVVPAVAGNGTATISGSYDPATGILTYQSNWDTLSGAPNTAGFYAGASGANGAAVGSAWSLGATPAASGNTSGTMTLTSDQANQLLGGNWYYTYNTTANPAGEVRGQISATR